MTTTNLMIFGIGTAVSVGVNILDHYLAHNPQLAANCTLQFILRMLKGMSQAAAVQPTGIEQHIISGVASVAEHAAEESMDGK